MDRRHTKYDTIWILASCVKCAEFVVLKWVVQAQWQLFVFTSTSWAFFWICSIILVCLNVSRGYGQNIHLGTIDILSGELPTAAGNGGSRKIILEVPKNFRVHPVWKITWFVGFFLCVASFLVYTYYLRFEGDVVVFTWTSFQIGWVLLRYIFSHFAGGCNAMHGIVAVENDLETLRGVRRERAVDLMFALSKYQTHIHPRYSYSYRQDATSRSELKGAFLETTPRQLHPRIPIPLSSRNDHCGVIIITSVAGDNLLKSAAWLNGSPTYENLVRNMALYDSCVITFHFWHDAEEISVAAVRALGKKEEMVQDLENPEPFVSPKGSSNLGLDKVEWYYWIKFSETTWIHVKSEKLQILHRELRYQEMTGDQIIGQCGRINVEMPEASTLQNVVSKSHEAGLTLLQLLRPGQG